MSKLINAHKESILKHTNLDWDQINSVKYLYEFDRAVQ